MLRFLFLVMSFLTFLIASDIAIVKKYSGDVFAKRAKTMVPLTVGSYLKKGDVLMTKKDSNIGVIFDDGTILSLGENSILSIDEYIFKPEKKEFLFDVNMKKGYASFESGKIGKLAPKAVKFRVPEGTVGIRGTKFYVEVK